MHMFCQSSRVNRIHAFSIYLIYVRIYTAAGARAGLEDSVIRCLGCWRSDAYQLYIRGDAKKLAQFSRTLVTENSYSTCDTSGTLERHADVNTRWLKICVDCHKHTESVDRCQVVVLFSPSSKLGCST